MGGGFPRVLLPGIIEGGTRSTSRRRGALGKPGIPTGATPGAREAARTRPITHPGAHHGLEVTWLYHEEGGKGITPSPGEFSRGFTPRGGHHFTLLTGFTVRVKLF